MTKTTFTTMNRGAVRATLSVLVLSAMSFAIPAALAEGGKDGKDDGQASQSGQSITGRSRTALVGSAAASGESRNGHAEFRVEPDRSRTRLNVEVEDVSIAAGTVLDVAVDHAGTRTKIGTIKLDADHSGELELNSQDGDLVPAVKKGDILIVMNAGVAILSGVF